MAAQTPPSPPDLSPPKTRGPIPPPRPAYLPTAGSPLTVDKDLYTRIQQAARTPLEFFTIPPRSGRAWKCPAKSIVRISTPNGPQVGDLNIWNANNPRERFWASRTKQLHRSHVSTYDRLWSCLPYMRPLVTIIADTLSWYGTDEHGGRCHDLLGTRCDPYISLLLSSSRSSSSPNSSYNYHCHSNLTRAILPFHLSESDVHDVINLFQITGLDDQGRYFMNPSPARKGDYVEFFCEVDCLMALSACPGGDLSVWGFGQEAESRMRGTCRELGVEVWAVVGEERVLEGWEEMGCSAYAGMHGLGVPRGEGVGT